MPQTLLINAVRGIQGRTISLHRTAASVGLCGRLFGGCGFSGDRRLSVSWVGGHF